MIRRDMVSEQEKMRDGMANNTEPSNLFDDSGVRLEATVYIFFFDKLSETLDVLLTEDGDTRYRDAGDRR